MEGGQTAPEQSGTRYFPGADAAMAGVILLLGLSLAGSGGSLAQRWRSSAARQQSLSFEDQLGIAANTTGLIVITWWAMSLSIAVASALLERCGRTAAATVTGRFSPAFMRRLAFAAIGFQLLAAPLATAATPSPDPVPRPVVSALWTPTTGAVDGLVLPRPLRVLAGPAPLPDSGPTPGLGSSGTGPDITPPWTPRVPAVEPGTLAARQLRPQEPADGRAEVTVRPGDSLWSLAAVRLGPLASDVDIAREWPRLYQANRAVIGESPHLLRPGQVLKLPAGG
jgi:hypothetical protein